MTARSLTAGEDPKPRAAARRPGEARFWYPYLLIGPTMITLTLVALVPFLYAVYLSLHEVKRSHSSHAWVAWVTGSLPLVPYLLHWGSWCSS